MQADVTDGAPVVAAVYPITSEGRLIALAKEQHERELALVRGRLPLHRQL